MSALPPSGLFRALGIGARGRTNADKVRELPASPADYADADSLLVAAPAKEFHVGTLGVKGMDGTLQALFGWTVGAVEYLRLIGGTSGAGATVAAWSDTNARADLNLVAKGRGGIYVANNSGVLAAIEENGSGQRVANHVSLRPGDTGKPGVVAAASWGGEPNVGIAITPLGFGQLTAHTPDNAIAGGNPRGQYATDWQRIRASGQHVASGTFSTLSGGNGNMASGQGATAAGGQFNTAGGDNSWVPGGQRGTTAGIYGKGAWASGRFAADGDAQSGEGVLRGKTTDATPKQLTADNAAPGAANVFNLPLNAAFAVRIMVVARRADGATKAAWFFDAVVSKDANNASAALASTPAQGVAQPAAVSVGTAAPTGWTVTLGADTTNGGISVVVTGPAGNGVTWVARVLSVEEIG